MLLNQIFENKIVEGLTRTGRNNTAVIGWGRGMGHQGHMYLASSVITHANESNADPYFVVSRAVGKDDPLTPVEKLSIYKRVFSEHKQIFQSTSDAAPNFNRILSKLQEHGYKKVIVVLGEDQVNSFQYLKNYNGKPTKAGEILYTFESIDVISRQQTNDPSRTLAGPRATDMRAVLLDSSKLDEDKFAFWRDAMSPKLADDEVHMIMKLAEHRLKNINNSVAEGVKQRLDPKCWKGYKKQGTKIKGGVRVNNCVPESVKQGVEEAGPFSYGAKNPRKGTVAHNATEKRKQQEKGKQPIEPKDQKVGNAKITKDVTEGLTPDEQFDIIEEMIEQVAAEYGVDPEVIWEDFDAVDDDTLLESAAWRRKAGKSKTGGLNAKGVASYRRENPGSKLQTAVTTKPSKLKPGSKAAKRRKSFCARMGGSKGSMKDEHGKPTRKALALRKWNCHEGVENNVKEEAEDNGPYEYVVHYNNPKTKTSGTRTVKTAQPAPKSDSPGAKKFFGKWTGYYQAHEKRSDIANRARDIVSQSEKKTEGIGASQMAGPSGPEFSKDGGNRRLESQRKGKNKIVPVDESIELQMASLIKILENKNETI